jgi:hypothetical protein
VFQALQNGNTNIMHVYGYHFDNTSNDPQKLKMEKLQFKQVALTKYICFRRKKKTESGRPRPSGKAGRKDKGRGE